MLDKRNVSPKMTPDWTPEKLDEFGKSRGRALAWARRAKMGEFVGDPYETLDLPMEFRVYAIVSSFLVAFAFGRATPNLLSQLDIQPSVVEFLQVPALAVFLTSLGSSIVAGVILAPSKNRNKLVWIVKGKLQRADLNCVCVENLLKDLQRGVENVLKTVGWHLQCVEESTGEITTCGENVFNPY